MVGRYSTGASGSSRIGKVNTLSRILWGLFQRTSDKRFHWSITFRDLKVEHK